MGEVYAGIDETLKRRVALKAIRAEHRLSPVSKARFLREAQLLSGLDHPNICRVYDFIEGDDSDWLVLELIEGKSLQTALRVGLDPVSRLRIAEQIADVLVATHTAGVVHRDLKPGNVMLTGVDDVKVLDFGLARSIEPGGENRPESRSPEPSPGPDDDRHVDPDLTAASPLSDAASQTGSWHAHTEDGIVLGTPACMSPEQARGEPATAASDMYSFGLVLQEVYTGRSPYPPGISITDLIDRARRADTLPPTGVPKDVAALIQRLKQLAPAERPTARETAARLAWVRHRPQRLARRLVMAGVVLAAALGAGKYTIDLARERTARDPGTRGGGSATVAGRRPDRLHARRPAQAARAGRQARDPGRGRRQGDELLRRGAGVDAIDEELLRRSAALYQIGDVRIAQGNLEAATPPLEESLTLAKALLQRQPGDGERIFGLAQSHFWVGFVHFRRQKLAEAEREFGPYLEMANRLIMIDPARTDWQREVAYANSNIGSVLEARGDLEGALHRYRACLRTERQLLEKTPGDKDLRHSVAASHNLIGVALRSTGKLGEALQQFHAELAIRNALSAGEPDNATFRLRLGIAHAHVGHVLAAQGQTGKAVAAFEQSAGVLGDLTRRDPANRAWQRDLAGAAFALGNALLANQQPAAALPPLRRAVAIMTTLTEGDPSNTGWRLNLADDRQALGRALLANGDAHEAEREAVAALKIANAPGTSQGTDLQVARITSATHALLARLAARRDDATGATSHWTEAYKAIAAIAGGSGDYRLLDPLAVSLVNLGRTAEARPVVEKLAAMGYRDPIFLANTNVDGPVLPARAR